MKTTSCTPKPHGFLTLALALYIAALALTGPMLAIALDAVDTLPTIEGYELSLY